MESILDYTRWVKSLEDQRGSPSSLRYTSILTDFVIYVIHRGILWKDVFTLATLEGFCKYSGYKGASRAIMGFSDYLYSLGRIDRPLDITKKGTPLPEIFEQYLIYHEQSLQASHNHIRQVRRILNDFHLYLSGENITIPDLNIEHIDNFMAGFKVAQSTRRIYRYYLKGFLKYLYHEKRIIKRDLALVFVGPPIFAQSRLPKFLRPQQVRTLFQNI